MLVADLELLNIVEPIGCARQASIRIERAADLGQPIRDCTTTVAVASENRGVVRKQERTTK